MTELKLLTYYSSKINLNHSDKLTSDCALNKAALTGDLGLLKYLVENNKSLPDCVVYGLSPLHLASFAQQYRAAEMLISYGGNVNIRTKKTHYSKKNNLTLNDFAGSTPLHFAATNNCLDIADLLLKNGADPTVLDKSGSSPVSIAVIKNHKDMSKLFEEHMKIMPALLSQSQTNPKGFDKFISFIFKSKSSSDCSTSISVNSEKVAPGKEHVYSKTKARKRSDSTSSNNSLKSWNKIFKLEFVKKLSRNRSEKQLVRKSRKSSTDAL